jgi:O-antigen/teichoic acid export membrane protein
MKATSLFGGVQVFNIIISIIRSKFIAVLIGPVGMGISGLLTATTGLISNITNFGLGISAVRDVASAAEKGNQTRISTVVIVLRRFVWITGILGTLVTLILSSWLSKLTFGNRNYTFAFIWISITLLLAQLTNGQMVVLQGMRKLKQLAKANVFGSALGLIITIPIYYKWRIEGIVPSIIIYSIVSLILSWYFARKFKIEPVKVTYIRTLAEGKMMLIMGFMISLSNLIAVGASYIVRIYISKTGGIAQVGLYNAGFAIIFSYVGLIFAAMATDYYPRLSSVANDYKLFRQTINQQAEIALLIISPILAVFFVFINWIIILLYSNKFVGINEMIHWAALGMFFKAASWAVAFLFLAKGASKLFFWSELLANTYQLLFNIIGYKLRGLEGMGISFFAGYFLYFLQVLIITKVKYSFKFDISFYRIFIIQFIIGIFCFGTVKLLHTPWTFLLGSFLILISVIYSYAGLNKRIGLNIIIINLVRRK